MKLFQFYNLPFLYDFRDIWANGIDSAINKQGCPTSVHIGMFLPFLSSQCSLEQNEWVERAFKNEILGTYAQVIMTFFIR